MPRVTSLLAGGSAIAALIAGSVVVGSSAMAETSGEPMAPMSTFDPELPRELGSGDLRRVFSYSCSLQGDGLDIQASSVRVEVESTIPTEVDPGDTIAAQPFKVEVTLPDSAYEAVDALGATHQEWTVPVGLTMRAGDEAPAALPGFDVSVPREPLVGVPWRLTMNGTLPPISVPNLMHTPGGEWYQHELWLDMPAELEIEGALQTPNGEIATTLACDGPADRALGGTWVTTWPRPTHDTPPTTDPTPAPSRPVPVGPGELTRSLDHQCRVFFGGLDLGTHPVQVRASADYPEVARAGDVLPARTATVSLRMPEMLRQATDQVIEGRSFEGESTEGAWDLTTAGRTMALQTGALQLPRTEVPQVANEPWLLPGQVALPEMSVPDDAEGALWLSLPQRFTVEGNLHRPDDSTFPGTLECSAPADRVLGGIALEGSTDPTPPPPDPITDPTTVPTTDPVPTDPVPDPGGSIDVGPGTLSRTANYRCAADAGGLFLGIQDFTLDATSDYLETAVPGDVLAPRPVSVTLTANELLRQATALLLGAREAEADGDAAFSITTAGRTSELAPTAWDFPRSDVPQEANTAWTLRGTGTIPAITVPQDATGALWLGLPARLEVQMNLHTAGNSTFPMVLECAAGSDRLLGGIALFGETDPTPPGLDTPDQPTWPTNPPTTDTPPTWNPSDPTDPPTTTFPSDPPTEPGGEPSVGPGEVSRTLPYRCEVIAGGLALGIHDVTVLASTDVPAAATPGEVLAPRPLSLTVTTTELLRQSTTLLLGAREHEAGATDTTLSLDSNNRTTSLSVPEIRFPRAPVPQEANEPWRLTGEGEIPAITVPADAATALWLGMPTNFAMIVTLHQADNSTIPMSLSCTGPKDRRFGGIPLEDPPTAGPTSDPTTEPTVEPTTQPTSVPTATPTPPALIQPTVKVGALGLWRSAVFTVGVGAKGALPTGNVVVKRGDKTVAKGRLFLGVTVLTAGNLPRGEHSFTITYEGDGRVAATSVTKKVRIL